MNDRDHFAAAALAGLLAAPTDKDRDMGYWARLSYEAADAMLRERTNHDAAPAARAQTDSATGEPGGGGGSDRTDKPATRPAVGTGDTQEPVTWAVVRWWDDHCVMTLERKDQADFMAAALRKQHCHTHDVVPLYRQPRPTLSGDELKAIRQAAAVADAMNDLRMKAALGGVLELLG